MTRLVVTATVASWAEKAYDEEPDTARTTRAEITFGYDGALRGEGRAVLLMAYAGEEADFVGLERVSATLDGHSGTFVVSQCGAFRDGVARSTWNVVPGTGTGGLAGLRGSGTSEAPRGNQASVTLDYELG